MKEIYVDSLQERIWNKGRMACIIDHEYIVYLHQTSKEASYSTEEAWTNLKCNNNLEMFSI